MSDADKDANGDGDLTDNDTDEDDTIPDCLDHAATGARFYVDIDATTGANDGTSWAEAFSDLQSALVIAVVTDDIWTADGTIDQIIPDCLIHHYFRTPSHWFSLFLLYLE